MRPVRDVELSRTFGASLVPLISAERVQGSRQHRGPQHQRVDRAEVHVARRGDQRAFRAPERAAHRDFLAAADESETSERIPSVAVANLGASLGAVCHSMFCV